MALLIGIVLLGGLAAVRWLMRPRRSTVAAQKAAFEHAVLVHLKLSDEKFGTEAERASIHALSDKLEAAIEGRAAGEFDGDEFGDGECRLFMYGPDADRLWAAVEPVLRSSSLSRGGYALKRYGPPQDRSAREVRVNF